MSMVERTVICIPRCNGLDRASPPLSPDKHFTIERRKEGRKERGYVISREIRFFHPVESFFLERSFCIGGQRGEDSSGFFFLRIYFIDRVIICKIYI